LKIKGREPTVRLRARLLRQLLEHIKNIEKESWKEIEMEGL
jgi:hypothetical protein